MDEKTNIVKMNVGIIAWCMCVITCIATVVFYKWYAIERDWLIDLAVSFTVLGCLGFGFLSFWSVLGAIRMPKEHVTSNTASKV